MLTAQGLFKEAWETILRENPFPGVCGRVCFHPCEGVCNRGEFDDPIAIHSWSASLPTRRSATISNRFWNGSPRARKKWPSPGRARRDWRLPGFSRSWVTPATCSRRPPRPAGSCAGGFRSTGCRLPALQREIAQIEAQGVRIHTGKPVTADLLTDRKVGLPGRLPRLRARADNGSCASPANRLQACRTGSSFSPRVRNGETPDCQGTSAVIGGGNTAVDVARSIVRLGGKAVILYRRRRQDMPAFGDEVQMALDEGVELVELVAPAQIESETGAAASFCGR